MSLCGWKPTFLNGEEFLASEIRSHRHCCFFRRIARRKNGNGENLTQTVFFSP